MFAKLKILYTQVIAIFGVFSKSLLSYSSEGLELSQNLQKFLTSGTVTAIEDIIPGDWAPEAVATALKILQQAIPLLSTEAACGAITDPVAQLNCFIAQIKTLPADMQDATLKKLIAKYSQIKSVIEGDAPLAAHYYDLLAQTSASLAAHSSAPAPVVADPITVTADTVPDTASAGSTSSNAVAPNTAGLAPESATVSSGDTANQPATEAKA